MQPFSLPFLSSFLFFLSKYFLWSRIVVLCSSAARDYLYDCLALTRLLSRSPEWSNISEKEREKLGLTFNDDGEFW